MTKCRPVDWKAAASEPLPGTVTFRAQQNLPKLPIPKLADTLARLRESLKPMAWSNAEYASVLKKIDNFETGKGRELHDRLLNHASGRPHWLEEWWDDTGYLGYRDSVCVPL